MTDHKPKQIGTIENSYGSLEVKIENGKYYWGIYDWGGCKWEEITEELYHALMKFENHRIRKINPTEVKG